MDLSMANHHMMTFILTQVCAFFSTMNMLQKSYEIVYIFSYPLPPLMRRNQVWNLKISANKQQRPIGLNYFSRCYWFTSIFYVITGSSSPSA